MKLENERKTAKYTNPDPYFIVPKMLYFLLNWLVYSPHAYIFQFIGIMWGLDASKTNLAMVFQIFNFFGAMFWGSVADATRKYKLIAAFCVIVNTAFVCAMAFPLFSGDSRFWYYNFLTMGQCFFSAGTFPMIDSIVLSILEADPSAGKDYYGSQKAFGTIAHNITTKVIHELYERFGQDFFVMYYSAIGSMILLVVSLLFLVSDHLKIKTHKHHGPAKKVTDEDEEEEVPQGSSTFGLLKKPSFVLFLGSILASGIVRSVNTNNHSIFLTDYLKLGKHVVGDLMFVRLIPELSLLFFAKYFMTIIGPYWFLILGQLSGLVRILLYLLLKPDVSQNFPYIYILYAIEALKGANSSMVSAAAFRIASDLAPVAWGGAAQTLVGGVWQGISMSAAAVIAYFILKQDQGSSETLRNLFAITGVLGGISFIIIFVHYSIVNPVLFKKKN